MIQWKDILIIHFKREAKDSAMYFKKTADIPSKSQFFMGLSMNNINNFTNIGIVINRAFIWHCFNVIDFSF